MRTAPEPGPLARLIRARALARAGMRLPSLPERSIDVGGVRRTYTVVPGPHERSPLLLVLHGAGGQGLGMAALSGLAERGPRAGFAVAFPDGWARIWNDHRMAPRLAWREGVDDVAFLSALCARLVKEGVAAAGRTVAVGISNGAFMAEHLARHELLALSGIVLVAGGATDASVRTRPRPPGGVTVLAFHGTADPLVPYEGGEIGRRGRGRGRTGADGRDRADVPVNGRVPTAAAGSRSSTRSGASYPSPGSAGRAARSPSTGSRAAATPGPAARRTCPSG